MDALLLLVSLLAVFSLIRQHFDRLLLETSFPLSFSFSLEFSVLILERVRAQRRSFQLYSALKNLISLNIFGGNLCNDSCWASQ